MCSLTFSNAILQAQCRGEIPLIADIKPISPRDGDLLSERTPAELAQALAAAGACALSVVTESEHFGGSLAMLQQVCGAVSLPVLRKDFVTSVQDVDDSKTAGASALLLILATTPPDLVPDLYHRAHELGMEVVVEVHTRQELGQALALSARIIGINNRDILQLEKDAGDVRVTETLAPLVPDGILTISESSLLTPEDITRAIQAGADAVLVGTAILQSDNLCARVAELTGLLRGRDA
ncbi:MAG: indole-3-glycerol-phosphate synthase [Phycisphaerae bacterium]|nr:indole-3-glycerol-phosphate synthase [Phycisphaerae bacterium]